jgi:hypothetical protein
MRTVCPRLLNAYDALLEAEQPTNQHTVPLDNVKEQLP